MIGRTVLEQLINGLLEDGMVCDYNPNTSTLSVTAFQGRRFDSPWELTGLDETSLQHALDRIERDMGADGGLDGDEVDSLTWMFRDLLEMIELTHPDDGPFQLRGGHVEMIEKPVDYPLKSVMALRRGGENAGFLRFELAELPSGERVMHWWATVARESCAERVKGTRAATASTMAALRNFKFDIEGETFELRSLPKELVEELERDLFGSAHFHWSEIEGVQ